MSRLARELSSAAPEDWAQQWDRDTQEQHVVAPHCINKDLPAVAGHGSPAQQTSYSRPCVCAFQDSPLCGTTDSENVSRKKKETTLLFSVSSKWRIKASVCSRGVLSPNLPVPTRRCRWVRQIAAPMAMIMPVYQQSGGAHIQHIVGLFQAPQNDGNQASLWHRATLSQQQSERERRTSQHITLFTLCFFSSVLFCASVSGR